MKEKNTHSNKDVFLAQWLAGEISDQQLKELVSNDDFNAFSKIRKGVEVYEGLEAPIDMSYSKIQERINNKKPKVKSLYTYWSIGIAASIILLFGLFTFLGNDEVIFETGFGETKTIALLDGSEVVLNAKSKITYNEDNWETNRTLTLDGEAYFKVKKGEKFTVSTDNGSVVVLGTQFNVNSTNDFFDVVCYEGKVGVKTLESDHILLPNNGVRKINGNPTETSVTTFIKPTWIDGESTFKSVPIKYVITALENQYNIKFITDAIDDSTIFSGSFPHNDLNVALQTVFDALDITYDEKEKRNIKLRY